MFVGTREDFLQEVLRSGEVPLTFRERDALLQRIENIIQVLFQRYQRSRYEDFLPWCSLPRWLVFIFTLVTLMLLVTLLKQSQWSPTRSTELKSETHSSQSKM